MRAGALRWFHSRLRERGDSEHGQALVRLSIALLILAYLWWLKPTVPGVGHMAMVMLGESLVGLGMMAWILWRPQKSHVRRWIGMVADYTTLGILMSLNPEALAPLYVLIMWVTIGNGLRYGTRYLYSATALGSAAFALVAMGSDYWRGQPYLAIGLGIGLVAIPMYLTSLLRDLHRVTEEARRANAAKTRFLATMSHELRSPLNGIIGMAELLRATRMTAEQREFSEVIHASAQSLRMLVDDVLDIAAIEAGKLQLREAPFVLSDVVSRLEVLLRPQAADKGVALEMRVSPGVPERLFGDGPHLTQILMNLLHNAVKFTDGGGVVLTVARRDDGEADGQVRLRFSVRDTGIGIADADKPRIFAAFEQIDAGPTRRHGGSGLGMTIASTLAQLLGGTIGLEDNPGGGSHFWLDVGMALDRGETVHVPDGAKIVAFDDPFVRHRARNKPLRVLVADDQAANRTVLMRILERAGHRVVMANDGEQALDQLEGGELDVAVIDLHMPNLSGIDVLRQWRVMQAGRARRTPVIVLSADATEQASRDALEAGARAFLCKPVVVARLLEAIAEATGSASADAPSQAQGMRANPAMLEELAQMGLDDAVLADLVEQCLRDAASCVVALGKAGRAGDWHAYRDAAHGLKGVAENLGITAVGDRCRQAMRADDVALAREHARWSTEMEARIGPGAEQSRRELRRILDERRRNAPSSRPNPERSGDGAPMPPRR